MNKRKKAQPQVNEKISKKRYSLLTFVLIICIAELAVSAAGNIKKNIHLQFKIKGLEQKFEEEKERNSRLNSQIKNFNSKEAMESISRNSLKMAGEDEILVIIHKPQDNPELKRGTIKTGSPS